MMENRLMKMCFYGLLGIVSICASTDSIIAYKIEDSQITIYNDFGTVNPSDSQISPIWKQWTVHTLSSAFLDSNNIVNNYSGIYHPVGGFIRSESITDNKVRLFAAYSNTGIYLYVNEYDGKAYDFTYRGYDTPWILSEPLILFFDKTSRSDLQFINSNTQVTNHFFHIEYGLGCSDACTYMYVYCINDTILASDYDPANRAIKMDNLEQHRLFTPSAWDSSFGIRRDVFLQDVSNPLSNIMQIQMYIPFTALSCTGQPGTEISFTFGTNDVEVENGVAPYRWLYKDPYAANPNDTLTWGRLIFGPPLDSVIGGINSVTGHQTRKTQLKTIKTEYFSVSGKIITPSTTNLKTYNKVIVTRRMLQDGRIVTEKFMLPHRLSN